MASEKDNNNSVDQDELAKEWANALAEQSEEEGSGSEQSSKSGESQDDLADEWAKALASEEEQKITSEKQSNKASAGAQDFQFQDISQEKDQTENKQSKRDLEFIMDIPLNVAAELGRSRLLVNDLLQLGQGSVIELDKLAGEPLEILVNGKLIARGEAVVINEKFGVRLTDIISPMERVKQLG